MRIICPNCNTAYNIRKNRIPAGKRGSATCKTCGHRMIIQVQPEDLCPACFDPLEKGLVRCTHCWAEFKKPRKALLRSLLVPGLGDFYLGHRFLGILEMMGTGVVWFLVISLVITRAPSKNHSVLLADSDQPIL